MNTTNKNYWHLFCLLLFLSMGYFMLTTLLYDEIKPNELHSSSDFAVVSFISFDGLEGCLNAGQYIDAAAKLGISWRQHSHNYHADMILIVTGLCKSLWSLGRLEDLGWQLLVVSPIGYTPKEDEAWILGNRYEHTSQFTKLRIWNMTSYKRILFLDADTFIIRHVDDFFKNNNAQVASLGMQRCDDLALKDSCTDEANIEWQSEACGAGVMLITPNSQEYLQLVTGINSIAFDRDYQEQAYLQAFYSRNNNRSKFAIGRCMILPAHHPNAMNSASIIHFAGENKPWRADSCKAFPQICDLWNNACGYVSCLKQT